MLSPFSSDESVSSRRGTIKYPDELFAGSNDSMKSRGTAPEKEKKCPPAGRK